jgi:branched-chain amino acid transport system ATP-binding protein
MAGKNGERRMPILTVESLSKSFGGVQALRKVCFSLEEGEILGLIGPNGSGKTTLFNVVSGFYKCDEGVVNFEGQDITNLKCHRVCQSGIARTFQIVRPFSQLTTLRNVMVGRAYGKSPARSLEQARTEAQEILQYVGLGKMESIAARNLTLSARKRLELARALGTKPQLLLLDEMMAGLTPTEIEEAMLLVKRVRDSGITIILVEHVMRAVMGVSDRIMVLNVGEKIAEGTPREIYNNKQVIEAYLGEEAGHQHA